MARASQRRRQAPLRGSLRRNCSPVKTRMNFLPDKDASLVASPWRLHPRRGLVFLFAAIIHHHRRLCRRVDPAEMARPTSSPSCLLPFQSSRAAWHSEQPIWRGVIARQQSPALSKLQVSSPTRAHQHQTYPRLNSPPHPPNWRAEESLASLALFEQAVRHRRLSRLLLALGFPSLGARRLPRRVRPTIRKRRRSRKYLARAQQLGQATKVTGALVLFDDEAELSHLRKSPTRALSVATPSWLTVSTLLLLLEEQSSRTETPAQSFSGQTAT